MDHYPQNSKTIFNLDIFRNAYYQNVYLLCTVCQDFIGDALQQNKRVNQERVSLQIWETGQSKDDCCAVVLERNQYRSEQEDRHLQEGSLHGEGMAMIVRKIKITEGR